MTGSNSGIGSASGQMRRKLESALGSVPNLLKEKSLNLSLDSGFFFFFPPVKGEK